MKETRETEFALNLVDNLTSSPFVEDLTNEIELDGCADLNKKTKEDLIDIIKKQHNIISLCYVVSHGFNKYNPCYSSHDNFRKKGFHEYKKMIESGEYTDVFNMFENEEVELDVLQYDVVTIVEPNISTNEFGDLSIKEKISYVLSEDSKFQKEELIVVRSEKNSDKYMIIKDFMHGFSGKIIYIKEHDVITKAAKKLLSQSKNIT